MSASRLSHFGVTATSASHTPSTTETSTAVAVPQVTAGSSAARPVLRRYAAAIATMRNISMPSRSVTRRIWPMASGGEDQLAALGDAQAVFAPVVSNDEFLARPEQHLARYLCGRRMGLRGNDRLHHFEADNNYHCNRHCFST